MSFEEKVLKKLDGLEKKFGGLDQKVGGLDQKVGGLDQKLDALESTVNDRILPKLLDLDAYVHEEMVTKKEFHEATGEMISQIDFLAQRSETHDQERIAGVMRMDRIEKRVVKLERKSGHA